MVKCVWQVIGVYVVVVLVVGGSIWFGQFKQFLIWQGEILVYCVVWLVCEVVLVQVLVVVGVNVQVVIFSIVGLDVILVINYYWECGLVSSLQVVSVYLLFMVIVVMVVVCDQFVIECFYLQVLFLGVCVVVLMCVGICYGNVFGVFVVVLCVWFIVVGVVGDRGFGVCLW